MHVYSDQVQLTYETDDQLGKWLKACYTAALQSKHPSGHTAAALIQDYVIILTAINGFAPGIESTPERLSEEKRHIIPNHAERAVIYEAARRGIATRGLTLVTPWLPCIDCANAIITSGIECVIMHKQSINNRVTPLRDELIEANQMLNEANVTCIAYDGITGSSAFKSGKNWEV